MNGLIGLHQPDASEYVYAAVHISDKAERLVKIGRSKNPRQRLRGLYCSPFAVFPGDAKVEAELHKMFDDLREDGTREWFHFTQELEDELARRESDGLLTTHECSRCGEYLMRPFYDARVLLPCGWCEPMTVTVDLNAGTFEVDAPVPDAVAA